MIGSKKKMTHTMASRIRMANVMPNPALDIVILSGETVPGTTADMVPSSHVTPAIVCALYSSTLHLKPPARIVDVGGREPLLAGSCTTTIMPPAVWSSVPMKVLITRVVGSEGDQHVPTSWDNHCVFLDSGRGA